MAAMVTDNTLNDFDHELLYAFCPYLGKRVVNPA